MEIKHQFKEITIPKSYLTIDPLVVSKDGSVGEIEDHDLHHLRAKGLNLQPLEVATSLKLEKGSLVFLY